MFWRLRRRNDVSLTRRVAVLENIVGNLCAAVNRSAGNTDQCLAVVEECQRDIQKALAELSDTKGDTPWDRRHDNLDGPLEDEWPSSNDRP